MGYSKKQEMISMLNRTMGSNRYIVNKAEEGQQTIFTCGCCGESHNFSDSIDYVGAVDQWRSLGDKCYACGHGYCHCKTEGKKFI